MPLQTFFLAPVTVLAKLARQIAFGSFPAPSARATAARLVARTVVFAIALVLTQVTVVASGTEGLALHTCGGMLQLEKQKCKNRPNILV